MEAPTSPLNIGLNIPLKAPLIIVGTGFLGKELLQLAASSGNQVMATCYHEASMKELEKEFLPNPTPLATLHFITLDVTSEDSVKTFVKKVHQLFSVSPYLVYSVSTRGGGEEQYRALYLEGLQKLLKHLPLQELIFVGSTSVYDQKEGEIVTETSATIPSRTTGQVLLEAEQVVLQAGHTVARLAGIYGPGRSILLKKFLAEEAVIEGTGKRWINQIHRDDAARALYYLLEQPAEKVAGQIFNVADNTPATQLMIYQAIADFLGKPLPPQVPLESITKTRKRGNSSKRVSNQKLRALGWSPHFKSYQEALPSLNVPS